MKILKTKNFVALKESLILSIITIFSTSLLTVGTVLGQNSGMDGNAIDNNQSQIVLSKTATGSTLITNNTAYVSGFDTTYIISGNLNDIKGSIHIIITSIIDDFTKSANIGYVKISNSMSNSSGTQIANPFASNDQIKQKVQDLLDKSISESNNVGLVTVRCSFGSSLDQFSCIMNPLSQ
jgi:hypothetical protein